MHFTHAYQVQHFDVLVSLVTLELVNSKDTVIRRHKVDELHVLRNILIALLNGGLMLEDVALFGAL